MGRCGLGGLLVWMERGRGVLVVWCGCEVRVSLELGSIGLYILSRMICIRWTILLEYYGFATKFLFTMVTVVL